MRETCGGIRVSLSKLSPILAHMCACMQTDNRWSLKQRHSYASPCFSHPHLCFSYGYLTRIITECRVYKKYGTPWISLKIWVYVTNTKRQCCWVQNDLLESDFKYDFKFEFQNYMKNNSSLLIEITSFQSWKSIKHKIKFT